MELTKKLLEIIKGQKAYNQAEMLKLEALELKIREELKNSKTSAKTQEKVQKMHFASGKFGAGKF